MERNCCDSQAIRGRESVSERGTWKRYTYVDINLYAFADGEGLKRGTSIWICVCVCARVFVLVKGTRWRKDKRVHIYVGCISGRERKVQKLYISKNVCV